MYRSAISTYGLWHQVCVDHGREFSLVLEIQNYLRSLHGPSHITPYVQSPSTEASKNFSLFVMEGRSVGVS